MSLVSLTRNPAGRRMTAEGLNSSQVGSSSAGGVLTLLHGYQELLAMASVDRTADIIESELRAKRGPPPAVKCKTGTSALIGRIPTADLLVARNRHAPDVSTGLIWSRAAGVPAPRANRRFVDAPGELSKRRLLRKGRYSTQSRMEHSPRPCACPSGSATRPCRYNAVCRFRGAAAARTACSGPNGTRRSSSRPGVRRCRRSG